MRTAHLPLDRFQSCGLTFSEAEYLLVALAACVTAAAAVGVAVSASTGTVCFALFFNGVTEADCAEASRTGAFHLGDGSHFSFSSWVCFSIPIYEHIFRDKSRVCTRIVTKGLPIALK